MQVNVSRSLNSPSAKDSKERESGNNNSNSSAGSGNNNSSPPVQSAADIASKKIYEKAYNELIEDSPSLIRQEMQDLITR